jgi:hypothetical protein
VPIIAELYSSYNGLTRRFSPPAICALSCFVGGCEWWRQGPQRTPRRASEAFVAGCRRVGNGHRAMCLLCRYRQVAIAARPPVVLSLSSALEQSNCMQAAWLPDGGLGVMGVDDCAKDSRAVVMRTAGMWARRAFQKLQGQVGGNIR